ncbi:MAG: protein phosphatase 2C domain-containing protein [Propionibacteriaceae bacterium]|nr:protein phosphatase 2C domain-containing protein [Propionibacteriaceae bacterium]
MPLTLRPIAHSEIGLVRKTNQDSGFVSTSMLLVADGMGGAAAGDLASASVVRDLRLVNEEPVAGEEALQTWKEAVHRANMDLALMIASHPKLDGMGTTICGGIFDGSCMNIVHIGDSRCYLYSEGELVRVTHDHSYIQSLIDDGKIDEKAAMTHPHRSLLLRVLNGQPEIKPDYLSVELSAGDRIMFCSDGLCGIVPDSGIAAAMKFPELSQVMDALIDLAHLAGGTDNITVIVADVVEVKTLATPEDSLNASSGHTLVFTPDPELVGSQDGLPLSTFTMSGLIGAAADPHITSLVMAIRDPGVEHEELVDSYEEAKSPADEEDAESLISERRRYSTRWKKPRWGVWILALLIVLILGGGGWGVYAYTTNQYFIGDSNGHVGVFQGISGDIAGFRTYRLYETTTIDMDDLPYFWRDRVIATIPMGAGGLDQAQITIQELRVKAEQCVANRENRPPDTPPPLDGC